MPDCGFTYDHYEEIMDLVNRSDFKVVFFNRLNLHSRELILRHDVDQDPESAYRIASIESRHGIRSTYFIWLRSPFYNVFDKTCSNAFRDILKMGHHIGLHFDETFYTHLPRGEIADCAVREIRVLKECLDTEPYAVSFHRPSKYVLESDISLKNGLVNTYANAFTREYKYISDSRKIWREGCLCEYLKEGGRHSGKFSKIHALVHPIWWSEMASSAQETLTGFRKRKLKYLNDELHRNIKLHGRNIQL